MQLKFHVLNSLYVTSPEATIFRRSCEVQSFQNGRHILLRGCIPPPSEISDHAFRGVPYKNSGPSKQGKKHIPFLGDSSTNRTSAHEHKLEQAIPFEQGVRKLPGNNIYMVSISKRYAVA
jgi:hypothetical protein